MIRLFYFVLLFFTLSCANVIPPTGGPKDTNPPILVQSIPSQSELNFDKQQIELLFNEEIDAPTLLTELIITPFSEDNTFTTIVRKNRLILVFEKPLKENTTYTFNFGESIKDLTEGNISKNVLLSFSTGSFIDTDSIKGNIKNLLTAQPADNYIVGLYSTRDTLTPKNSKPVYFTKTNADGTYILRNIKEDSFHLYTFNDKNKNLVWNEEEAIGFEKSIQAKENPEVNVLTFPFDGKAPTVRGQKYYPEKNDILFSEGIKEYKLNDGEFTSSLAIDGKMLTIYQTKKISDTLEVPIQLKDSVNLTTVDTLKIFYPEKEKGSIKKGLSISPQPNDLKLKPGMADIVLQFNQPVTESRTENIFIISDTVEQELTNENFMWINNTRLNVKAAVDANDSVQLVIPEKSFISFDTFNLKTTYTFTYLEDENFGSIRGRVITNQPHYIIQLLDSKYKVIETVNNPVNLNFNYLTAGSYYLRVILDENNNQQWDQGNPFTFQQPEPIIFYKNAIELRANWEINDIQFSF